MELKHVYYVMYQVFDLESEWKKICEQKENSE